ncbi:hypothetical protein GCM10007895_06040 [Paraferrimonas sedimenticola]|uniref:Phage lysis regulatory protein, LysB family n=1 Tax=Paraferrimonas sedimenticola TaxID=375674 RepID=A0AA37RUB8_9GAMM|nr:hypothetical protein [Paraferrimonas sedimenticola]GLP95298.1 hypothetical protein GCM10007895_06040 [Paraferrimonas sedimenticola]
MLRLLGNGQTLLIGAVLIVAVVMGLFMGSLYLKAERYKAERDHAVLAQQVLQSDLDALTQTVRNQEAEKQRLKAEYQRLVLLNQRNEQAKAAIGAAYQQQLTALDALRAENEQVKRWADSPVPNDIKRLLQHGADHSNGDSDQSAARATTRIAHTQLPDTPLYWQHQCRADRIHTGLT